ncbi:hypothetical protein A8C56_06040 [Niabella ginsenosidivorans]|uniref:Uncharacterized protein n=1 Tax=Niabella ginsenosidivorans TaxID=1176587 RepID=A0A1A9I1J9_9BACT|nr:hypothetical protein A8C56_06040 [Niabella ginsenosidivorans]
MADVEISLLRKVISLYSKSSDAYYLIFINDQVMTGNPVTRMFFVAISGIRFTCVPLRPKPLPVQKQKPYCKRMPAGMGYPERSLNYVTSFSLFYNIKKWL